MLYLKMLTINPTAPLATCQKIIFRRAVELSPLRYINDLHGASRGAPCFLVF